MTKYFCDGCGKDTGESGRYLATATAALRPSYVGMGGVGSFASSCFFDVCSEACAVKCVTDWLASREWLTQPEAPR